MKVKELIQYLTHFDQDYEVVTSHYDEAMRRNRLEEISAFKIELEENRIILANMIGESF